MDGVNLRVRGFFAHGHKIALLVGELAPTDVSPQHQALLVVVMKMRRNARASFERRFTADRAADALLAILRETTPEG